MGKCQLIAASSLFSALVSSSSVFAENKKVYVCIEKDSNGFTYVDNAYSRSGFKNRNFTMIQRDMKLEVKIDDEEEAYSCSKPFLSQDILQCVEKTYFMVFNPQNLRFNRAQMLGPVLGTQKPDGMLISYGSCQRVN